MTNVRGGGCPPTCPRLACARVRVYELPPGQAVGPYHYEDPEEEWLLVVSGTPTLRHPGGEDQLVP